MLTDMESIGVRYAHNIADLLIDPFHPAHHGQKPAHELLSAAILHVMGTELAPSLVSVLDLLSDPTRNHKLILKRMMEAKHLGDRPHPQVVASAQRLLSKSRSERAGVFTIALSQLERAITRTRAAATRQEDRRRTRVA